MVGEEIEREDRTGQTFIHLLELYYRRGALGGLFGDGIRAAAQRADQASVPEAQYGVGTVIGSALVQP